LARPREIAKAALSPDHGALILARDAVAPL
jgi:hypothetical protein